MLPDIVPVIAQSMLPLRTLATISVNGVWTGMAPSAVTQSAWVALEMRMRRPLQVGEAGERLGAEGDLRRVGIDREQLDAVAIAQQGLEVGTEGGDAAPQGGDVGVQAGQVGSADLGIEDGAQVEQRCPERNRTELHQAQHLLAADAGAIERHDLGGDAAAAEARELVAPERLFMARVLVDAAQAADDAQALHRRRLRRCLRHARRRSARNVSAHWPSALASRRASACRQSTRIRRC